MRGEEAAVLAGIIMGIAVLELELQTSPEVLDTASDELDLSLYLKDGNYLRPATEEDPDVEASRYSEESFNAMADKNATLTALNERLQKQAAEAEAQRAATAEAAAEREAKAKAALDEVDALRERTAAAEARAAEVEAQCKAKLEAAQADMSTERSTYNESRAGLNDMFDALSKQLETEKSAREEMEADLARAREARAAAEAAVERAEANDQARQSTIEGLRKQLREVKNLNLRTLGNLQVRGGVERGKGGEGKRMAIQGSRLRLKKRRAMASQANGNRRFIQKASLHLPTPTPPHPPPQELQDKLKEEKEKVHSLSQLRDRLQSEQQSLQHKLKEAASAQERLQGTLLEVTNRLKVRGEDCFLLSLLLPLSLSLAPFPSPTHAPARPLRHQTVDGAKTDMETKLISEVQWRESLQADLEKERKRAEEVGGRCRRCSGAAPGRPCGRVRLGSTFRALLPPCSSSLCGTSFNRCRRTTRRCRPSTPCCKSPIASRSRRFWRWASGCRRRR